MAFEIREDVRDTALYVKLIGLMDYSTVDGFEFCIPERISSVVVDFSELDFIDSTGIGAILSILYTASERDVFIKFIGLSEVIHDLFQTIGVFDVMAALQLGGK